MGLLGFIFMLLDSIVIAGFISGRGNVKQKIALTILIVLLPIIGMFLCFMVASVPMQLSFSHILK